MHISVLRDESIDSLRIVSGDIVVDGTLGGGGHTLEMIKRYGSGIKIIGLDLDRDAVERTKRLIGGTISDATLRISGFQSLDKVLSELNITHVDKILLDLGISSFQLESSGRGFTFQKNEPLLMTMKAEPSDSDLTAEDIVNTWEEKTLADIIYGFGEEKYSRAVARAIVTARKEKAIETTFDLVQIIDKAIGKYYKRSKINPATKTFQALRIAVNSELTNLEKAIEANFKLLKAGGRMAIISFHSLEDRIVKRAFIKIKNEGYANIVTKKPITPSQNELEQNPRARSAKLRVIEKI